MYSRELRRQRPSEAAEEGEGQEMMRQCPQMQQTNLVAGWQQQEDQSQPASYNTTTYMTIIAVIMFRLVEKDVVSGLVLLTTKICRILCISSATVLVCG